MKLKWEPRRLGGGDVAFTEDRSYSALHYVGDMFIARQFMAQGMLLKSTVCDSEEAAKKQCQDWEDARVVSS